MARMIGRAYQGKQCSYGCCAQDSHIRWSRQRNRYVRRLRALDKRTWKKNVDSDS